MNYSKFEKLANFESRDVETEAVQFCGSGSTLEMKLKAEHFEEAGSGTKLGSD